MGRERSPDRRRRSRSPRHDSRGRGGRYEGRGESRDRGSRRSRDRSSRREEEHERGRRRRDEGGRESDRLGGRDERRRDRDTSGIRTTSEARPSRWGNAAVETPTTSANGVNGGGGHFGMYGPADTGRPSGGGGGGRGWGGGGGGRGSGNGVPRDESWVEHRLKLRAEARPPRGVWNRSPSPPKKKEPKAKAPLVVVESGEKTTKARGKESRKEERVGKNSRTRDSKRRRRRRSPSPSSSDSSSSSSSSSSSDSDNGSDSSSSSSSSSSDEEARIARRSSAKSKKRPQSPSESAEQGKAKVPRSAPPESLEVKPAEVEVNGHDKIPMPSEEMDEMDAAEAAQFKADVQGHRQQEESDDEAGPMPVPQLDELQGEGERGVNYGGALLPGEGAAIAQFVQKGLRIPRRGEVGWAGQEIEKLEDSGYVMSGSRHARMNAVRLRKENQVFNAEERRALALIMFEEKQQKENEILGNFRQMLTESTQEAERPSDEGSNAA